MSGKEITSRQKLLAVLSLAGAVVMAFKAGGDLSWAGIACYTVCMAGIIKNHPRTLAILWAAAGVHVLLTGYSQVQNLPFCPYCLAAAGFTLLAATSLWKLPAAVVTALLMICVWYAWPWYFSPKEYQFTYPRTRYDLVRPPESQAVENTEPEPAEKAVKELTTHG